MTMQHLDKWWEFKHSLRGRIAALQAARDKILYPEFYSRRLSPDAVDRLISAKLESSVPFMVGRWGSVESRLVGESLWKQNVFSRKTLLEAHRNAGIFPSRPDVLTEVANCLYSSAHSLDVVGCWDSPYQAKLIADGSPGAVRCDLTSLEPWLFNGESWLSTLEGRTVLVVHPFVETISSQASNLGRIFTNGHGLPACELKLVKPPVTLGHKTENFASWIDAFADLKSRVASIEFDVALIGCGAYGLPLAACIKAMGKPSIHLGGALQLLFGIRGRRWEAMPQYAALMNDSWVRPSPDETPRAANKVDGGCYW